MTEPKDRDEERVSVILPAFNEEGGIGETLEAVRRHLDSRFRDWEIVVVDDGSTDGTAAIVRSHADRDPRIRLLGGPPNRGKGYAVRRGMLEAAGETICFLDADLSTPIEELDRARALLAAGADVAVGTRRHPASRVVVHQPACRERMGDVFRRISLGVLGLPVTDITCGFKAFRRGAARALFASAVLDDWSFDAEILYAAKRMGFRMVDLPVTWRNDPNTKVRLVRDAAFAALGVARVLWRGWRGKYPPASGARST